MTPASTTTAVAPVIGSLLDTDLYKFTMWQPLLHAFPGNQSTYRFLCRNTPAYPLTDLMPDLEAQLDHLCTLRLDEPELAFLGALRYMKSDFIDFLRIFRFQRRYLSVSRVGDLLCIEAKGPQIHVMGFEIYVLAIVNELYCRRFDVAQAVDTARARLADKIALLREAAPAIARRRHPFEFFDFGTRRRLSGAWHAEMVRTLAHAVPDHFKGTSNVLLAMRYGIAPIGTMAHEYLQTFQAVGFQLKHFQKAALEAWVQEYRGDLGIALTDVVGMEAFIADFDLYFAKLFDGLRHDSGDPAAWGEKAIAHYGRLGVPTHAKRLVFSDSLTVPKALALHDLFADRIQCGFGIGTNLSNDAGVAPLNIVMKLVECNGQPVAKLSDSPGKSMCTDQTFLAYLRQVFHQPARPPDATGTG